MPEQGFLNPVFDAQRVFRTVLTTLAEPGRVLSVDPACIPPVPVDPAAAAIVLALCDGDTPLWLSPSLAAAAPFFRFCTGAPIAAAPADAAFLVASAGECPRLADLRPGTADYPDRAATLIIAVDALEADTGWRLSGPGIPSCRQLLPRGLAPDFVAEWQANHARFPLGVDVLFTARDCVAGLPRSTRLEG